MRARRANGKARAFRTRFLPYFTPELKANILDLCAFILVTPEFLNDDTRIKAYDVLRTGLNRLRRLGRLVGRSRVGVDDKTPVAPT